MNGAFTNRRTTNGMMRKALIKVAKARGNRAIHSVGTVRVNSGMRKSKPMFPANMRRTKLPTPRHSRAQPSRSDSSYVGCSFGTIWTVSIISDHANATTWEEK